MGTLKDSEKTRKKLIEAAGHLFSERGINGVTVRDIVNKAKVPLSAINYHFGAKEELYREVLLEACQYVSVSSADQESLLGLPPEEALYVFINESVKLYRSEIASSWQAAVIAKECLEPSKVFDDIMKEHLRPQAQFIAMLVSRVVDKPADAPQVHFAVMSLIGLLDTFGVYGQYIQGVFPGLPNYLVQGNILATQLYNTTLEIAGAPAYKEENP